MAAPLVLLLLLSSAASAQEPQARVYVSGDGLFQALFDPFSKRSSFELFQETGSFTAIYPPAKAPALAGTVGVRLWRSIGVGGTLTRNGSRTDATVEGAIPHPFFFDRNRVVEGPVDGIEREEVGVHLQFRLIVPVTRRFDLTLFAGPSRWRIRQDRIATIGYTSQYPFDSAQLGDVAIERADATTWGYNAGVDVGWYVSNHIGAGALLLLATANPDAAESDAAADTRIGGLRAGGGLRLRF